MSSRYRPSTMDGWWRGMQSWRSSKSASRPGLWRRTTGSCHRQSWTGPSVSVSSSTMKKSSTSPSLTAIQHLHSGIPAQHTSGCGSCGLTLMQHSTRVRHRQRGRWSSTPGYVGTSSAWVTDAAELRHLAYGRPAYERAQNCGLGGRKRKLRDADNNVVLDDEGNPVLLEPTRHINDIPGCHRSYLTVCLKYLCGRGMKSSSEPSNCSSSSSSSSPSSSSSSLCCSCSSSPSSSSSSSPSSSSSL
mmetsp:Transcript_45993/g.94101  ORF Transcript_45993/g.94101 Transcript_45993/m.94101 type:complete len:245 (-) Transcript_45993:745-1479(-)